MFWGYGIFSAIYLGNIVKGVQTGPNYVDFKDGEYIRVYYVHIDSHLVVQEQE